jgi:hypothetical protein
LYFEGGRLVHAECEGETGFEAVVTMLGWSVGEAAAIGAIPAPERSIDLGCEALLLRAAHRLDEARRSDASRPEPTTGVVPRMRLGQGATRRATPRPPPLPEASAELPPLPVSHSTRPPPALPPRTTPPVAPARPLRVVRMSRAGTLRQLEESRDDALADRVFVAARAAQTLGDALGLGRICAFHLQGEARGLVVCCGESITGVEGRSEPLAVLTEKLRVE